jgi:hypothetical protein
MSHGMHKGGALYGLSGDATTVKTLFGRDYSWSIAHMRVA